MNTQTFKYGDLRFRWADIPGGDPLVFQHGLGGDLEQALNLLLPDMRQRLIGLDCRGHGESDIGHEIDLSFSTFADDLITLLDHLSLTAVALGGVSMGAGVALNLALRYPLRVSSLILVRPAWLNRPMEVRHWFSSVAQHIRTYGVAEGRNRFEASAMHGDIASRFPATALSLLSQFDSPRAEDAVARLERLPADAPVTSFEQLRQLSVPSLILAHANDPIHRLSYGREIAQSIPGSRFGLITPKADDPRKHALDIGRAIREFLLV